MESPEFRLKTTVIYYTVLYWEACDAFDILNLSKKRKIVKERVKDVLIKQFSNKTPMASVFRNVL